MNTFRNLQPIELSYQQLSSCTLKSDNLVLNNGLQICTYNVFKNVKDVNLNNNTCLILTDTQQVGDIFTLKTGKVDLGDIPVDISLQPIQLQEGYINFNKKDNTFKCDTSYTKLTISKTKNNDGSVFLMYDEKYVCVDKSYPFYVRLKSQSEVYYLDKDQYTFYINEIGESFTFRVNLDNISRYLSLGASNTLMATGMYLGEAFTFHYLFRIKLLSTRDISFDSIATNKWVTYYMNLNNRDNNNNVEVNKVLEAPNNFLVSLNISEGIDSKQPTINISNLKTNFTPTGVGTSINNLEIDESSVLNIVNEQNICINTEQGIITFTSTKIKILN